MTKRHDTSSDHDEYDTGSSQGSFNLHKVISTAVTVQESSKENVVHAFKKIIEDGTATRTFYAGVLSSSTTLLAGIKGEVLFLSHANETRPYFQTTWVCGMIFSALWTLAYVIIMNTIRGFILHILHILRASRSGKNEVELKSIVRFLNYEFISGSLTGGFTAWVCINLSMGFYWTALGTTVVPFGILVRNRYIHQNIMKGEMQVDDL
eukprot:scaffold689243_cov79-Attheya_sp.AAC.1